MPVYYVEQLLVQPVGVREEGVTLPLIPATGQ